MKDIIRQLIRESLAELVDEISVTGAVQGYMTPGAFKPKKKKKTSEDVHSGEVAGYQNPIKGNKVATNEEEQMEPYDAETDTFAPGPRQRPENWKTYGGGKPKFRVQYAVAGLEQIPDSTHATAGEAMKAASEFIRSYKRGPDSKVERLDNGVALKHVGGGTVAIATIDPIK